jgi:hypothetical protein
MATLSLWSFQPVWWEAISKCGSDIITSTLCIVKIFFCHFTKIIYYLCIGYKFTSYKERPKGRHEVKQALLRGECFNLLLDELR